MKSFTLLTFIFLTGITCILSSCDKDMVLEEHQSFLKEQWNYSDVKTFSAEIKDTVQHYNLVITLRHGFNFGWRNLWINIETTFPGGRQFEKRVNLLLSEGDGVWFGDCLGDNCDIRIPLQENAYFPELGTYKFRISQDMRQNALEHIKALGLEIQKVKSNPTASSK